MSGDSRGSDALELLRQEVAQLRQDVDALKASTSSPRGAPRTTVRLVREHPYILPSSL